MHQLLLRPILAANQHSIYGAVADFVPRFRSPSRTLSSNVSEDVVPKVPSEQVSCPTKNTIWNSKAHGNLVQQRDEQFFKCLAENVKLTLLVKTPDSRGMYWRENSW